MLRRVRPRLNHATVVAYLALFVALSGSSYAAVQLSKGQVKGKHIAKNAVTEAKVKDGSLLSQDFKAGQLAAGAPGAQGPKGDTGARGPKGDTGAEGPKGDTGAEGPKGDTGAEGPKGDKGDPCLSSDPACKGSKGDKGDPGPGSLVASTVHSSPTDLRSGCSNATSVSITVPGPGKVLLEANANLGTAHTYGTPDQNILMLGTSASDCSPDGAGFLYVPASWPTASSSDSVVSVSARRMVTVSGAGTFTYYLNNYGELPSSNDDSLYRKAMTATYFPN